MIRENFFSKNLAYLVLFAVSLAFLLSQIYGFIISTDIQYWVAKAYDYSLLLRSGDLIPNYSLSHPAVTVLYLGSFFILLKSLISHILVYDFNPLALAYKLSFVFAISLFIPYIYYLLKKNSLPAGMAFIAGLLLSTNPEIWTANAADILWAIFSLCAILCFFICFAGQTVSVKYFFLSAFFTSLAIISRYSGVLLLVVFPLLFLYYRLQLGLNWKKFFLKLAGWILLIIIFIVILWPNVILSQFRVATDTFQGNLQSLKFEGSYFATEKSDIFHNIKTSFTHLPLVQLYFLFMFILFMKKNFTRLSRSLKIFLIVMIILVPYFYFYTIFIVTGVWSMRYSLVSNLIIDIIVAFEIWRQFSYIYSSNKYKKLFLPYLIFCLALYIYSAHYWLSSA